MTLCFITVTKPEFILYKMEAFRNPENGGMTMT